MRVLIIIDDPSAIRNDIKTTMYIGAAAQNRGHKVRFAPASTIECRHGTPRVRSFSIEAPENDNVQQRFYDRAVETVSTFDCTLMRDTPPLDSNYLFNVNTLSRANTTLLNPPAIFRSYNEKTFATQFTDLIPDETLVARNHKTIRDHVRKSDHNEFIMKPLIYYAGTGIKKISTSSPARSERAIKEVTENGTHPILVQPFLDAVHERGDKRIAMLNGEPLTWCRRLPPDNDYIANISQDGSFESFELTERDREIISTVGKKLKQINVLLAGIDIIGDALTEVNFTAPWCPPDDSGYMSMADTVIDGLEETL